MDGVQVSLGIDRGIHAADANYSSTTFHIIESVFDTLTGTIMELVAIEYLLFPFLFCCVYCCVIFLSWVRFGNFVD